MVLGESQTNVIRAVSVRLCCFLPDATLCVKFTALSGLLALLSAVRGFVQHWDVVLSPLQGSSDAGCHFR